MRLFRLAALMDNKYHLISKAATWNEEAKRAVKNAFNLYVNPDSPSLVEPILQMLADSGEPVSKNILSKMNSVVANLDHPNHEKILGLIKDVVDTITPDAKKEVRNFIHTHTKGTTEAQRNHRERLKSKFDTVTVPLVSVLSKIVGRERVLPIRRMELSKEKLLMFSRSAAAQKYGFDNLEVLTRLLSYPDLRDRLTTLINAVDRGHIPADGPEIMKETGEIKALLAQKAATNEPFLEAGEDEAQEALQQQAPETIVSKQMLSRKEEIKQEREEEEIAQHRDAENAEREKAFQQEQIEKDRERHIGHNTSSLSLERLLRKYQ